MTAGWWDDEVHPPRQPDPESRAGTDAAGRLAEALPESLGPVSFRTRSVPRLGIESELTGYGEALIAALLPVVRELQAEARAEGAAGALNAASHEVENDDDAELLARRAIQWENQLAAALREEAGR